MMFFFFFKQKTAYEMRISDWSSDVCSSDLDVVLAWILRLGEGRDPGEAAKRLITDYELDREPPPTGACGRLVAILRETAEFPPGCITRPLCQPRRRGRWRRHRPRDALPAQDRTRDGWGKRVSVRLQLSSNSITK